MPLYALPWLYLFTRSPQLRERRAKWLVHIHFRGFVEYMRVVGILRYRVENLAELQRGGQLILANHPSLIDVVFLIAFVPRADCVVKSSLFRNPTMRGVITVAGYIANDDPERVLEAARKSLDRGNSLIIFPEGTRTTPGKRLKMQRGAANLAVRLGQVIRPVVITVSPTTLTKAEPWYSIPAGGPFEVVLRAQSELAGDSHNDDVPASLAARKLTTKLENYFTKELVQHAGFGTGN